MRSRLTIWILILSCTLSCVESFDFSATDPDNFLVVDGRITQSQGMVNQILLSRTSTFIGGDGTPETGAQIVIVTGEGLTENYQEVSPGMYLLEGDNVVGAEGNSSSIEITLSNGEIYRSQPEVMPSLVRADSIYFRTAIESELSSGGIVIDRELVKIFIDTPISSNDVPFRIRWTMEEAYSFTDLAFPPDSPMVCYAISPFQQQTILLASGEDLSLTTLKEFELGSRSIIPKVEFVELHYFSAFQHSLTEEAYEYWEKIAQLTNRVGTIFDTPPAPVQGNVFNVNDPEEVVLGYFEVTAIDTIRTFTRPSELEPFFINSPCEFSGRRLQDFCFNCLLLDKTSLERPDYWGQR